MSIETAEDELKMKRCIAELLDRTFILGANASGKKAQLAEMYRFITGGHLADINERLEPVGFGVLLDAEREVLKLRREPSVLEVEGFKKLNKVKFSPDEMRLIFTLWDLYGKKSLADLNVVVTFGDIVDCMSMNNLGIAPSIRESAMRKLKAYNLIYYSGSYTGDKENMPVWIFPSIQLGLPSSLLEKYENDFREANDIGPGREEDEAAEEEDSSFEDVFEEAL